MSQTQDAITLAAGFAAASESDWLKLVERLLKGADFERRLVSRSADGIAVGPLYTRKDGDGAAGTVPGRAPYTRGFESPGVRSRWRIRQVHAFADPAVARGAIAEDATGGVNDVTLRIAGPGQVGLPAMRDAIEAALVDVQGMQVFLEPGAAAIEAADAVEGFGSIGGLGIDPVGALARTGEMDLLAGDGTARFSRPLPWLPSPATTLVADGRPFHEAGGSEGQELAGLIGALVFYLRAAEANGHRPADALPRIGLTLAADADLFLTIAKLRAARRLVARVAEACGIASVAGQLRLAVTTSERMLNRRGPWVNMLRTTAATAAAAIGGADAIGVLPFTWPLGEPDTFARRIARNTHHVLAEESGLVRAADPAGGAWSVEMLTEELAGTAWKIFQAWEAKGGIVAALKSGQIGDEIGILAAARNKAIATGHLALTGTSAFPQLGSDGVTAKPWPATPACTGALLPSVRLAAPFERLRDAADRASPPPRVFLATLGPAAEHGARAAWVANLLAAGGIAAVQGEGYTNSADAGRAFAESGTALACLCGTDAAYGELGETVAGVLRQAGATRVYLAGKPQDAAALKAAGVDAFWFAGADMTAILAEVHGAIGIG